MCHHGVIGYNPRIEAAREATRVHHLSRRCGGLADSRTSSTGKLPRVGYLSDEPPEPNLFHSRDYILARLDELGYGDGRNIIIEYRYADGQAEKLASMAAELVGIPVDLIVAIGTPASRAGSLAATRTIPIVMARIGDPVGYGLVASLARPGGNATAVSVFTEELAQKRLEVLRDAVPGLSRVCALYQSNFPPSEGELKQFMAAAPRFEGASSNGRHPQPFGDGGGSVGDYGRVPARPLCCLVAPVRVDNSMANSEPRIEERPPCIVRTKRVS